MRARSARINNKILSATSSIAWYVVSQLPDRISAAATPPPKYDIAFCLSPIADSCNSHESATLEGIASQASSDRSNSAGQKKDASFECIF